ncbi:hypothetical protein M569_16104, partial [Genlisea aurea]
MAVLWMSDAPMEEPDDVGQADVEGQTFTIRKNEIDGDDMMHQSKSIGEQHCKSKSHLIAVDQYNKRMSKVKAEPTGLEHVTTLRQPTLLHVVKSNQIRHAVADDVVYALLGCGIPMEKVDHPFMRGFLQKYTQVAGCVPRLGSEFPSSNILRLYNEHIQTLRRILSDKKVVIMFDEFTDAQGNSMVAVLAQVVGQRVCIDVQYLVGEGPNRGPEHKEVAAAVLRSLAVVGIDHLNIEFVYTDEGSIIIAAGEHQLKATAKEMQHLFLGFSANARWFLCLPHKLHGIGSASSLAYPSLCSSQREGFASSGGEHSLERLAFHGFCIYCIAEAIFDAADWYLFHLKEWTSFLQEEAKREPRGKEKAPTQESEGNTTAPKPLLQRVVERSQKQATGMLLRLLFISDMGAPLIACLNLCQSDRPVYFEDAAKSDTFPPRIQEVFATLLPNRSLLRRHLEPETDAFFRTMFHRILENTRKALVSRFEKMHEQIEFYRQVRVFNPNNLPDMAPSHLDYPALRLTDFKSEFAEYVRSTKRDVEGPEDLVSWWNAHPSS